MSEDLSDLTPPQGEDDKAHANQPEDAIWHSDKGDVPVKITERIGSGTGKEFVMVEGSSVVIPVEHIEVLSPSESSEDPAAETLLSVEKQQARQKIVELLNHEQAKALKDKRSWNEKTINLVVSRYEALREVAQSGNFDEPVFVKHPSGREIGQPESVREYIKNLFDTTSKAVDGYFDLVEQGDETKRTKLEETYELFDLVEEAEKAIEQVETDAPAASHTKDAAPESSPSKGNTASKDKDVVKSPEESKPGTEGEQTTEDLSKETTEQVVGTPEVAEDPEQTTSFTAEQQQARKAIIDYLDPRIRLLENRKDSPDPGDELQLSKLRALKNKVDEGKFTEYARYSGVNEDGKNEIGSHSALSYFARVKEYSDEGSGPYKNAANIMAVLQEAGVDISDLPDSQPANGGNKIDNGNNKKANGNHNNNKDKNDSNEQNGNDSTWLDPRRIQELKDEYEDALRSSGKEMSAEAKQHLKTILIEREIRTIISTSERVKDVYGVGEVPARPSDKIIQKMAELMDRPREEINNMATKKDELVLEQVTGFKKDQSVKIKKSDGSIEDGWTVRRYSYVPNGPPMVQIVKGKKKIFIDPGTLKEYQEYANPDKDRLILEELKPYFDGPAKIKTDEGIIVGQFQGYKDGDQRVYYGYVDAEGISKRLGEAPASDFLSWQNERLTAEVEAEEKTKKEQEEVERIAELERKVVNYLGKKVKVKDAENNWLPGFKCLAYLKDEKEVIVADQDDKEYNLPLEFFIKMQEEAGGEETLKQSQEEVAQTADNAKVDTPIDSPPATMNGGNKLNRKERREKRRKEKEVKQEEGDKAINAWLEKTTQKWERHGLPYRLATGTLGFFALGGAALAAPVTYPSYRIWRKRLTEEMRQKEAEKEKDNDSN